MTTENEPQKENKEDAMTTENEPQKDLDLETAVERVPVNPVEIYPPAGSPPTGFDRPMFHEGDQRPAILKLVQKSSAEGTPGKLLRLDTLEEFDQLEVIPVNVQMSRTKWPTGGFNRERQPECSSRDGKISVTQFPDGREPLFVGQPCRSCEFYTTRPGDVKGQEFCDPGYDVIFLDAQTFEAYGMRLYGTSAKVARVLGSTRNFCNSILELTGKEQRSTRGSWYQLNATRIGTLEEPELAAVHDYLANYDFELLD